MLVDDISVKYATSTIVYNPVSFLFNGVQVRQNTDISIFVDADGKLEGLQPILINRMCRKELDMGVLAIELSAYLSENGSLVWIRIAASPFAHLIHIYCNKPFHIKN